MEKKAREVLRGSLECLPQLNSRLVRIFISSTFTDTVVERNALMEDVYPKIKDFCKRKYGLDFQVVDMRWGVRKEASDDHSTSGLCLQEIYNCQKLSTGPNFVAFLGQKHGYRPLQPSIPSTEFEKLKKVLVELEQDVSLLDKWYVRDENALPPVHVLQPISSLLTNVETRKKDWEVFSSSLKNSLKLASQKCFEEGLIDVDTKHKYFMSVTEAEIIHGVLKSEQDPTQSCLCFIRIIDDIDSHLSDTKAWRFIDIVDSNVDSEAQQLLQSLRDDKVAKTVEARNIHNVQWSQGEGIDKTKHGEYLQSFCDQFNNGITQRIDNAMRAENRLTNHRLYVEVLQHSLMAATRCESFHGREDILAKIKSHVTSGSHQPLVVFGDSGCGKTSVMAKAASQVPYWIEKGRSPVVMLRFLGTSPQSSTIRKLLFSVCYQISENIGKEVKLIPSELTELLAFFHSLLMEVPIKKPLILILDSLDQLSAENFAHKLNWLPKEVPPNVCLIVSTLPQHFGILDRLHTWLDEDCFLNVPALGEDLSLEVLQAWLSLKSRSLTSGQMELVKMACEKCSLPLYVKLMFEKVLLWRSYTNDVNELQIQHTLQESIKMMFERLEMKHGTLVVHHSLSYLTASQNGLSEVELEDLLSLDDNVLNDVFQFHIPPVWRIPPLIWVRIRHDISAYLVDKEADETRVSFWYHRQFIEAARERYLSDEVFTKKIHSAIADYFAGKWHKVPKPFTYNKALIEKFGLVKSEDSADRKVADQPLIFGEVQEKDEELRYNKRKLNQLPFHLAQAGRDQDLKQTCLFNYQWLHTKLIATSIQQVLDDFKPLIHDAEVSLVERALNMSQSTYSKIPESLSLEISGRLLPYITSEKGNFASLSSLIKDCFLEGAVSLSIVPRQQCFTAPGGPMKHLLENPDLQVGNTMVILSPDSLHLFALTKTNFLLMWDLDTGEVEKQEQLLPLHSGRLNVMKLTLDQKFLILGTVFQRETNTNPVVILDSISGEVIEIVQLDKISLPLGFTDSLSFGLTDDKILLIIAAQHVHTFSRSDGKFLKEFSIKCDQSLTLTKAKRAIFHIQQSNVFEIYDLDTLEKSGEIICQGTPLKIVLVSHSQQGFIAFKNNLTVQVVNLDPKDGEIGKTVLIIDASKQISEPIMNIAVSTDEKHLLLLTKEAIVLWSLEFMKYLKSFLIPNDVKPNRNVLSYTSQLTHDSKTLVSTYEEYLLVWNVKSGQLIQSILADKSILVTLIVSSNGKLAVTTSKNNNNIKVWKIDEIDEQTYEPLSMSSSCRYLALASTGDLMVTRSNQANDLAVVDINKGQIVSRPSKNFDVFWPSITPDGNSVVLREYTSEETVKIWDSRNCQLKAKIPISSLQLKLVAISNDSSKVATVIESEFTAEVVTKVWSTLDGKLLHTLDFGKGFVNQIYFVLEDTAVAVSRQRSDSQDVQNLEIAVYDLETGNRGVSFQNVKRETMSSLPNDSSKILFTRSVSIDKSDKAPVENLVVLCLKTGKLVMCCPDAPAVRRINISGDGSKGIDAAKNVFHLIEGKRLFQFEEEVTKRFHLPQLNWDAVFAVWISLEPGIFKIGHVANRQILAVCPVHSLLMSLYISKDNIITIGCEDGRIMLLQLCDSATKPDLLFNEAVERQKVILKSSHQNLSNNSLKRRQKVIKQSSFCSMI